MPPAAGAAVAAGSPQVPLPGRLHALSAGVAAQSEARARTPLASKSPLASPCSSSLADGAPLLRGLALLPPSPGAPRTISALSVSAAGTDDDAALATTMAAARQRLGSSAGMMMMMGDSPLSLPAASPPGMPVLASAAALDLSTSSFFSPPLRLQPVPPAMDADATRSIPVILGPAVPKIRPTLPAAACGPVRAAIVMWGFDDVLCLLRGPPPASSARSHASVAPGGAGVGRPSPRAVLALERAVLLQAAACGGPNHHDAAALARAVSQRLSSAQRRLVDEGGEALPVRCSGSTSRRSSCGGDDADRAHAGPGPAGGSPPATGGRDSYAAALPPRSVLEAGVTGVSESSAESSLTSGRSRGGGSTASLMPVVAAAADYGPQVQPSGGAAFDDDAAFAADRALDADLLPLSLDTTQRAAAAGPQPTGGALARERAFPPPLARQLAPPAPPSSTRVTSAPPPLAAQRLLRYSAASAEPSLEAPGAAVRSQSRRGDSSHRRFSPVGMLTPRAAQDSPRDAAADEALFASVTDMRATPRPAPRAPFDPATSRLVAADEPLWRSHSEATLLVAGASGGWGKSQETLIVRRLPPLLVEVRKGRGGIGLGHFQPDTACLHPSPSPLSLAEADGGRCGKSGGCDCGSGARTAPAQHPRHRQHPRRALESVLATRSSGRQLPARRRGAQRWQRQ